jgi:anti-sigma factor RsiW
MSERDGDFREQTAQLKRAFDPVMTEPIPARMYLRKPAWHGYARAAGLLAIGIAIGMAMPSLRRVPVQPPAPAAIATPQQLAVRAAQAHAMYTAEPRHPIEVRANEEHLVRWLSRRLDYNLKVPVLAEDGFDLMGGRLLPAVDGGAVALFMYQDAAGKRLTLSVTRRKQVEPVTAFQIAQEGPVSVFYWIDKDCGYFLSGDLDKARLARVAASVYRQLED